jgi:hypothetical protein
MEQVSVLTSQKGIKRLMDIMDILTLIVLYVFEGRRPEILFWAKPWLFLGWVSGGFLSPRRNLFGT